MPPPIFRPLPCSRSRAYESPIDDSTISSHRQRERDLHNSGSYDPRDTPAAFREARDGRRKSKRAQAPPSLRDIAEQAYDDLETGAEAEAPRARAPKRKPLPKNPLHQTTDRAINRGRWVSKSTEPQPGEAIEPLDPAPKKPDSRPRRHRADPAAAQAAKSNQAPEHWSAEDKATFAKLPKEGQSFLLKRHGDMEAEFTRKSQASAGAVQFTQALAPVFNDPQIARSLQQAGVHPVQAIHEWANWHRMGTSDEPRG